MNQPTVTKPVNRSPLRKKLGKEYFIVKRQFKWMTNQSKFAKIDKAVQFDHTYIKHQSFLLRPLKDVDMILQHNKVKNLEIAIGHIDGVVIKPGQTFSIWQMVGRPTKSKGYLEGLVLENGRISKGIGGGLCQLGNLLYWMALHTPLTITERWRHSYDVFPDINRSIPFACGATLSYNYVDLQITNTTDSSFQINLWLDKAYLNGEITSNTENKEIFEVFETDHMMTQQWWGGYTRHNKIWKRRTHQLTRIIRRTRNGESCDHDVQSAVGGVRSLLNLMEYFRPSTGSCLFFQSVFYIVLILMGSFFLKKFFKI